MVCVDDLIGFIRENFSVYDNFTDTEIYRIIDEHIKFRTISILHDEDRIIGLLRINIYGNTAHILDIAVTDGYKFNFVARQMALELWEKFPYLRYFQFERMYKYPLKKMKLYTIKRFMKLR